MWKSKAFIVRDQRDKKEEEKYPLMDVLKKYCSHENELIQN